ncbi:MAG: V-type ATP synthase subunit E [Eubacterium sp.]|nr:V-type ATP synthase subunit E [Eubacterium sp.]
MTGLDKIKKSILDEAAGAAKSAMDEAVAKAKSIEEESKAETEKKCAEISQTTEFKIVSLKDRTKSSAELERNRKILETKQALITEIIEKAKTQIKDLPDEEYFNFLLKIAEKSVHAGEGTFSLSKGDLERLPSNFAGELKEIADRKGAKLTIATEAMDIDDGFVLSYGGVEENCTLEAIFADKKDELSDLAQKILFQ